MIQPWPVMIQTPKKFIEREAKKQKVKELGGSYLFTDKYQAQHRSAKIPLVATIPIYNNLKEGTQYLETKRHISVIVETRN